MTMYLRNYEKVTVAMVLTTIKAMVLTIMIGITMAMTLDDVNYDNNDVGNDRNDIDDKTRGSSWKCGYESSTIIMTTTLTHY